MSWTHNICLVCWHAQEGTRRPVTIISTHVDTCCWCGSQNDHGIFKREDPKKLKCCGVHKSEEAK